MEKAENICKFIPSKSYDQTVNMINFVYETNPDIVAEKSMRAVYILYVVVSGHARLKYYGKTEQLEKGCVFFTFPSCPFSIDNCDHFSYLYVSFIGTKGTILLQNAGITHGSMIREKAYLIPFVMNSIKMSNDQNIHLLAESVLLYCLANLYRLPEKPGETSASRAVLTVKKYADDHFSEPSLSLEKICKSIAYNPKYISGEFKRQTGAGFCEYLRTLRIQNACAMIGNGYTCVSEIASFSGFADPLHFSKVFKAHTGISPKEYIKTNRPA